MRGHAVLVSLLLLGGCLKPTVYLVDEGDPLYDGPITPRVSIQNPVSGSVIRIANNSASFPVSGTCNHAGQLVALQLNGSSFALEGGACDGSSWQGSFDTRSIAQGIHTIQALLSNGDGSVAVSQPVYLTKDTVAPTVAGLSDDPAPRKTKSWNWSCSKANCSYRFVLGTAADAEPSGIFSSINTASQNSGDGTYFLHVQAIDAVGNASEIARVSALIDNTPPVVTIEPPVSSVSNVNQAQFPVSGTCTEAGQLVSVNGTSAAETKVVLCADGPSGGTWATALDFSQAPEGQLTLTADYSDAAGNAAPQASVQVLKDTGSPAITIGAPSSTIINSQGSVSFQVSYSAAASVNLEANSVSLTASGGASCAVSVNDGTSQNPSVVLDSCQGNGSVAIVIQAGSAQSAGGNPASASAPSQSFIVDNTPPSLAITQPADESTINLQTDSPAFSVIGTCSEPGRTVSLLLGGSPAPNQAGGLCDGTSFSASFGTTALPEGEHLLRAKLTDDAGNETTSATIRLNRDVTPPANPVSLALIAPSASPGSSATPRFELSVAPQALEIGDTITLHLDDPACAIPSLRGSALVQSAGATFEIQSDAIPESAHVFYARVTDAAGNPSACLASGTAYAYDSRVGVPAELEFAQGPQSASAGAELAAIQVRILDALGSVVSSYDGEVSLTFGFNAGAATLSGTTTVSAVSGAAIFTDLSVNKAASGYTLSASAQELGPITSSSFDIAAGAPAQISIVSGNAQSGVAGAELSSPFVISVKDGFENAVSGVLIDWEVNTGGGSFALSSSSTNSSGEASAYLTLGAGSGQNSASATVRGSELSANFTATAVAGAAALIAWRDAPPSDFTASSSSPMTPFSVEVRDSNGNILSDDNATEIQLSVASGTGTLGGTLTRTVSGGVATFDDITYTKAESLTIRATEPIQNATITSAAIDVKHGLASQLSYLAQPSGGVAGQAWATQPVVEIQDAYGNRVTTGAGASAEISLVLSAGSGALSGANSLPASEGVASFSNLSIELIGSDKVLTASTGALSLASQPFAITHAAASKLVFTTQPGGGASGATWTVQPVLEIQDTFGNRVSTGADSTATVNVVLSAGSGTLSGNLSKGASAGIADFSANGLKIDLSGTKALTAEATLGGVAKSVISANFEITPSAATRLVFSTQPGGGQAGASWAQQPVIEIQDDAGNPVASGPDSSVEITLSVNSGSGALLGTANIAASDGVATFSNLSMNVSGSKTLSAQATLQSGSVSVASGAFTVTNAAASQLVFTQPPGGGQSDTPWEQQPVIEIRDAYANRVTTGDDASAEISLDLIAGEGVLSGSTTMNANEGIADFAGKGLKINLAGADKILRASLGAITRDSEAFSITNGPASLIGFATQPGGGSAGQAWAQQPVIEIKDAAGNRVTQGPDASAQVILTLTNGTGALSGTVEVLASEGLASFSGLSINLVGSNKVLTATKASTAGSGGSEQKSITSDSFSIQNAPASQLVFTTQPGGGTAGVAWAQQPVIEIRDAFDNLVTTAPDASAEISLTLAAGDGALSGTTSMNAVGGIADFSGKGLKINLAGTDKVLTATKADTSGANGTAQKTAASSAFTVVADEASSLVLSGIPGSATAGAPFTITVTARDSSGNAATGYTGTVTLSSSDPALVANPTSFEYLPANAGAKSFEVSLRSSGSQAISAGDGSLSITSDDITVSAAEFSLAQSEIQASSTTMTVGQAITVSLVTKDAYGNESPSGIDTVAFELAGESSAGGSFGVVSGPGTYSASFTASSSGTAIIAARINGQAVTSLKPSVTVSVNPPGAFSIAGAEAGNGQVTLSWGASSGATSYTVKYGTSSGSHPTTHSTSATSPTVISGLENGTTYYFMVTAVNSGGSRDASSEADATPSGAVVVSDNFNRADGGLGANWTAAFSSGPLNISSNQVTNLVDAGRAAFWSANSFSPDQYAEAKVVSLNRGYDVDVGVTVRQSPTNKTMYILYQNFIEEEAHRTVFGKFVNGALTPTFHSAYAYLRLEASGTTIRAYGKNTAGASWTLIGQMTDDSIVSGSPGIYIHGGALLDDFSAGNL